MQKFSNRRYVISRQSHDPCNVVLIERTVHHLSQQTRFESITFHSFGTDNQIRMRQLFHFFQSENLVCTSPVIFLLFIAACPTQPLQPSHRYGVQVRWTCGVSVYYLFLACRVSFSTRASVQSRTTVNQLGTHIRRFYVPAPWWEPGHRKPVLGSRNWLRKLGERAHDRN